MNIVRPLTYLDLSICAAFACPGISDLTIAALHSLSIALGFAPVTAPVGLGALFINIAGLFGVLWNVAMLQSNAPQLHKIDLLARCAVIALIAYHFAFSSLTLLFAAFIVSEIIGGIAKIHWLKTLSAVPE